MTRPAHHADRYARSRRAHDEARQVMPGGVSSPVRAFKAVGRTPVVVKSGRGAVITDLDGNSYIDYVMSYGPLILGHAPRKVLAAITRTARRGTSFGMPTELETRLAKLIIAAVPSIELVRFVNSGTEAVMSAIRLARAAAGRDKIIKCAGCYHGHSDSLLVQAGSGATTLGTPSSPGVPRAATSDTVLVPYNDLPAVARAFRKNPGRIAAMCVEPIAGNMGLVPPVPGYLPGLRKLCDRHGALLLFDEVMTGFRVAYGGAQSLYNVKPDLTCLGKIVGGGLPCAAYGGGEKIMRLVAPDGPVYQAGTLSGNPLAMAAGIATLESLRGGGVYKKLEAAGSTLAQGLAAAARQAGVPVHCPRVGSMVGCFFSARPVVNYSDALACDTRAFAGFFGAMLDRGVMLPPSQFEAWFLSTRHGEAVIAKTLAAAAAAFNAVAEANH